MFRRVLLKNLFVSRPFLFLFANKLTSKVHKFVSLRPSFNFFFIRSVSQLVSWSVNHLKNGSRLSSVVPCAPIFIKQLTELIL